jgi:hypothetical protein
VLGFFSDYSEAIVLQPELAEAYYKHKRGLAHQKQRHFVPAQADFDKAEQLGYTGPQ